MPRLPPSLFRQATQISPHLPTLLPVCRDIPSAASELRWIKQHIAETRSSSFGIPDDERLRWLCRLRGRGAPLQYVLGSQPFGPLDIKCRPGVLIPRPEPEAYTTHLAKLLTTGKLQDLLGKASESDLSVLDFCTGTGCIALLFAALTHKHFPNAYHQGVDVSPAAVRLSRENLKHNQRLGHLPPPSDDSRVRVTFTQADIFAPLPASISQKHWDVLISNPPYVSTHGFAHNTSRSVRNYEPKLAQVPEPRSNETCRPEDVFYARLLEIASVLKPKIVLFEAGDLRQAERVVQLALRSLEAAEVGDARVMQRIEIWRDWPDGMAEHGEVASVVVEGQQIPVQGNGHGRSVFLVREYEQAS